MRTKVYGGYHSGRVVVLPENVRENDYITLPRDLPAGEMFQPGRTNPEMHANALTYQLRESTVGNGKYLSCVANPPRFIRSVTVPPVPSAGITINL